MTISILEYGNTEAIEALEKHYSLVTLDIGYDKKPLNIVRQLQAIVARNFGDEEGIRLGLYFPVIIIGKDKSFYQVYVMQNYLGNSPRFDFTERERIDSFTYRFTRDCINLRNHNVPSLEFYLSCMAKHQQKKKDKKELIYTPPLCYLWSTDMMKSLAKQYGLI